SGRRTPRSSPATRRSTPVTSTAGSGSGRRSSFARSGRGGAGEPAARVQGHHADPPVLEVPVRRVQAAPVRPPGPPLRKVRSRLVSHVRPHTRRTKRGPVRVKRHTRKGKLQPRRAWANAKRSRRALKQRRRAAAALYATAAVSEIVGFATLRGGGALFIALGVALAGLGYAAKRRT